MHGVALLLDAPTEQYAQPLSALLAPPPSPPLPRPCMHQQIQSDDLVRAKATKYKVPFQDSYGLVSFQEFCELISLSHGVAIESSHLVPQ